MSPIPGVNPQLIAELLLLAAAGEGLERRDVSGELKKEEPQPRVLFPQGCAELQ